ncbi:MAG: translation elongation factor 4, partial [Planctomycetaceae bacterium]|nr:translation elongation factor 4 [Planctomycetaceae bacterium]
MDPRYIRNFSIVAHIDHGKSTLADRLIQFCGALSEREAKSQFLDKLDIERERGITVKAQTARLNFAVDGVNCVLNLIDTPGHVDFSYEVSRSLQACEGAILVVDASQGVEAQTLANVFLALDNNLELIPVLNKIDLPGADIDAAKKEIEDIIGIDASNAIGVSAKEGTNVELVLRAVVEHLPPPKGDPNAPLEALIFDAWFDSYQGVVAMIRLINGTIKVGEQVQMMHTGKEYEVLKLGVFTPHSKPMDVLSVGEVGFLIAGVKELRDIKIGDTVTHEKKPTAKPLPGFKEVKPMVFCGIYPTDSAEYPELKVALEKLTINDSAITYEIETSEALGFGFRVGFLGLLHMEIVQERLEREFGMSLVTTAPTVAYKVNTVQGEQMMIENPAKLPGAQFIDFIEEPIV